MKASAVDAPEKSAPGGPSAKRRPSSLSRRLTLSTAALLAAFVSITAVGLDRAFSQSARAARQELLLAQVYRLMAAAEVDAQGRVSWPGGLPETRLELADSGLYASIVDTNGVAVWQSPSAQTRALPSLGPLPAATQDFARLDTDTGPLFVQRFGLRWSVAGASLPLTFAMAEDLSAYEAQLQHYRRSLWGWLAVMAIVLLVAQAAVLRWGLRPLRQVAAELKRLQAGRTAQLPGPHPREIQGLADNLNQLLANERRQQRRYRDALADLAHSLKTPLALMRAELREARLDTALNERLNEQIGRMDRAVAYQLQRAEASSRSALALARALTPQAERLLSALRKVHANKAVAVDLIIAPDLHTRLDEGELSEVLGNLLDNAFKWCQGRVSLSADRHEPDTLWLEVSDDGPGFDADIGQRVLERGVRADEQIPGHGIGLSIVRELVSAREGHIVLGRSSLGGASVQVTLPGTVVHGSAR